MTAFLAAAVARAELLSAVAALTAATAAFVAAAQNSAKADADAAAEAKEARDAAAEALRAEREAAALHDELNKQALRHAVAEVGEAKAAAVVAEARLTASEGRAAALVSQALANEVGAEGLRQNIAELTSVNKDLWARQVQWQQWWAASQPVAAVVAASAGDAAAAGAAEDAALAGAAGGSMDAKAEPDYNPFAPFDPSGAEAAAANWRASAVDAWSGQVSAAASDLIAVKEEAPRTSPPSMSPPPDGPGGSAVVPDGAPLRPRSRSIRRGAEQAATFKVSLANLPRHWGRAGALKWLEQRRVAKCRFWGGPAGAVVAFDTQAEAEAAIAALNGCAVRGSAVPIRAGW